MDDHNNPPNYKIYQIKRKENFILKQEDDYIAVKAFRHYVNLITKYKDKKVVSITIGPLNKTCFGNCITIEATLLIKVRL